MEGFFYKLATEKDLDFDMNITWRIWANEHFQTKSLKKCTKKAIQVKSGTKKQCLEELLKFDILKPNHGFTFIFHFFSQSYQTKIYNECKETLMDYEVILLQDFSQNIELTQQDAIKGAHWHSKQITVHPTIAFVKMPGEITPKKYMIVHLSDIKVHGASMVHYITTDCIKYLKQKLKIPLGKIYLWSDGCAAQYKGKNSFFFLSKLCEQNQIVERNFFVSEHGKSESDAATSEVSRCLRNAIKSRRAYIQSSLDAKTFLASEFNDQEKTNYVFKEINNSDLKPIEDDINGFIPKPLDGTVTRSLHQIKPDVEKGFFLHRRLSCVCISCKEGKFTNCLYKTYTQGNFSRSKLPSAHCKKARVITPH